MPLIQLNAVWQYQSASNTVPPDIESVVVPNEDWITGNSPFGEGPLPLNLLSPNTVWSKATGLWIRRFVICEGEKDVILKGNCEQSMFLFWNGEFIGSVNPTNSSREDVPEYRIIIDRSIATPETHEIAILCLDDSGTSPEDFSYISLEADYLPAVFPFQPQAPVLERLSWATDVAISRNGTEQRKKLSDSPRQEFKYSFPTDFQNTPKAQNLLWGDLKNEILIPIWTQAVKMSSVSPGLSTISLNTSYSEFRAPGFAVIWKSSDDWQIVGIYEMTSSSITISNLTRSFSSCWIMPARIGVLSKGATKQSNGYNASFDLDLMIRDNSSIEVEEPEQFLSEDIYTEETLLSGDTISQEMKIDLEIFDPGIGKFSFVTGLERTRQYREFRVLCEDNISSWNLRKFLNRRSGRYREFYQPTFENDIRIESTGSISDIIQVSKDEYMRASQSRSKIAIETNDGWLLREIIDVSPFDSDSMFLTLNSDLNIDRSEIKRISFLSLKRLDTDSIDISHLGAGISQSSFLVVEIA